MTVIPVATLLANDVDADGDVLTISGFGPLTPHGGRVVYLGTQFTYTPPFNFNGTDSFQYSVYDGPFPASSANHLVPPTEGGNPEGWLIIGTDGRLYGTTYQVGVQGQGTVFRVDRDGGNFTVLHAFGTGSSDGRAPTAGVTFGNDGFLYGTTRFGGAGGVGTVYRVSASGDDYETLYSFVADGSGGLQPLGGVVQGTDDALYGTTWQGGSANGGVLFKDACKN